MYFNKDDAESSSVKIIFETNGNKITRILFKNNGFAFRPEDWDRLVSIAEGNPDEQKMGAFGIGFYTLFSVTENPFVSSGGQGMAFYWRGNQLFTKRGSIINDDDDWTTFIMDTREPLIIPNIEELKVLSQFIDVYKTEEASIIFRIAKGSLNVPNNTSIQMLFTEFDERNTSKDYYKDLSPIFKDLISYPEQGKIYIGFPTNQTTGSCSHLAARVIPTMERELIDFAEQTLAEYNNEMLCLGGTLSRILYEYEMAQISNFYNEIISSDIEKNEKIEVTKQPEKHAPEPKMKRSLHKWLIKRFKSRNHTPTMQLTSPHCELLEKWAAYAIAHFTYNTSTPNVRVSKIAETQFLYCLKQNLHILSTNGIHPITNVRLPNPEMAGFIKTVPLVPKNLLEQCEPFFNKAKNANLTVELSFKDVLVELKSRALSEEEIIKLLKWWISYLSKGNQYDMRLLKFTRIGDSSQTLDTIKFYLNPHKIFSETDVPFEVIPYNISKNFTQCIPTKFGMKLPNEAYFQNEYIFPNLPTIKFQNFTSGIRFLMEYFGVRKIVELKLILERLVNQEDCDFVQVIKYLASIYNELKNDEKNILINESIWPKENLLGSQSTKTIQHFVARDLYVPIRSHRELGLSIIDWNAEWSNSSKEGKFLIELGLQEYPKLETILRLVSHSTNPKIRELALKYFIDNFDKYSVNYKPEEINIAFLPCSTFNTYAKPSECFTNDRCMIMNFKVIREDLRSKAEKFGIRQHPNHENLIKKLTENPPQDKNNATKVFEYLYSRQHDFIDANWNTLNNSKFIPIKNENKSTYKHIKPRDCFFKLKDEKLNDFFLCVDFGIKANEFLSKCGVRKQTSNDFAKISVDPSHKLWKLYVEKYPVILENINPNLEKILNLAAPPTDSKLRTTALKYFIDNFDRKYVGVYNPETVNIAFLPCSYSNAHARPSDCFINDECKIMEFKIICEDLRSKAEKFGVQQSPDYKKLTEKLIENPPQNKNEAKKFIPIQDESRSNNKYIKPNDCFFKLKDDSSLNEFFLCVDFGIKANEFLTKCGVREPSSYDFAEISVDPSHKLWKLYVEKYLVILEKINPNLEKILNLAAPPNDPKLRATALKYFIDNFDKKYDKYYKPEEINIAFLPCSNSDTCTKPSDCFIDDECKIMGFKIIREDLRFKARDFGVRQNPNREKLIARLTENPPKSENVAKKVFEYLNTQQKSFTDSDWKMLKDFKFIPIQYESLPNKFIKPRECFLKLKEESLNNFFPCVDFGIKANEFLAKCGVREPSSYDFAEISVDPSHELWEIYVEKYPVILEKINPNLKKILKLAAPPTDLKLHAMALKYFIDNFDKKYVKDYKPEKIDIAFLPCSNSNSYAKPLECFINDECKIMGFKIIREDLRSKAEDFGVCQNPNSAKLINRLTENSPKNVNMAKEVFEYLNTQQKGFTDSDWKMLKDFEFIPIQPNKLVKPRECFLKLKEESLNNFFRCVDFGIKANEFLVKCGVKEEPSSYDFDKISVDPSHKLWKLYVEKYPVILEKINPNFEKILNLAASPNDPKLRATALKYFIDNFDKKYAKVYRPEEINIAFLPCSNFDTCAKPSDCFTNYRCMIMNFKIIHEDLRSKAGKFGVHQNPNCKKLINRLIESPPENVNMAKEVFEYLNTQQKGFTDSDWNMLKDFEFIPIQPNKLVKPRECFLKLKEESLNNFFSCIDFGIKANEFLAKCGVREPSSYDFDEISVDPSHKLWKLYVEKYPVILEKINPNLEKILNLVASPNDPKLCATALKYFIDNFDKKYAKDYKPEKFDIAFLPCSNSNSYAKPSECFINDVCKIMGFKIIREDLRSKAEDFGVRQNPNRKKLIARLTENPPKSEDVAKKVFEYLNARQEGFTDSDWNMLKDFEFIPIQPNKLVKPRECFLKLKEESLNNFFICVDFGIKANEFLVKCGVKEEPSSYDFDKISVDPSHKLWKLYVEKYPVILEKINPNLEKILNLVASPNDPKLCATALKYFIDNFDKKYAKDYKPEKFDIAFLPCSNSNSYAKPSECFINDECKIMGFKIIREDLRSKAEDFGVRQNPNREKLIARLNDFLPCVDFGTNANKFLAKCGVNYDLLLKDAHRLLFKSSHDLWDSCKNDTEKYLHILEKINDINNKFPEKNLNNDDVLIAIKTDNKGNNSYCLATVKEIYINDDKVYYKNLNPFTPPENLRDFYKKLGCRSLHKSVTKSVVPYGPIQETKYSQQLQRIIRERASLFYLNNFEYIRKDEKWLKKLKVREIEYMETSYKLGSITKNERNDITTNIFQQSTYSWILYVTPNANLIDISQQIVNHIFTRHYENISYFNTILTAPLSNLKKMGIPELQNDQQPQSTSNTFSSQHNENISSENTRDLRNFLQVIIKSCYSNSESNINRIKTCIDENKMNYCETMPGNKQHNFK
ncbi:hypothetical protein RhiirA4_494733 [Rhizophagus irregularis]|uniref:Uncharacterized protein n=1 Tax=Rhizophagus irregularis TaxID=588596 RepID=A0A2I1GYW1_9GLOM|nr:hypothetical protein RhiirA4_494733 [Rhizophagus irregularis]